MDWRQLWERIAGGWYLAIAWFFLIIVGVTVYEVVVRYVFNSPTVWVAEFATLLAAAAFLISGIYAMRSDSHLSITVLRDAAPPRVAMVLEVIKLAVILTFAIGIAVFGFRNGVDPLLRWERAGTRWNPPTPALIKPLILVVGFVIGIQAIINFARNFRSLREKLASGELTADGGETRAD
jgi:TRAP-type C4-dicarboxylate transport system permease small subunit